MSIADFKANTSGFKKTEFIKFTPGQHVIRFLQEKATTFSTHFSHDTVFRCLGDECPVCQNNKRLIAEMGYDKAKDTKSYIPVRQVAYINVLDRTPAKVCPNCGLEAKKVGTVFPGTCTKCNTSLVSVPVAPLEKVRMLNKGKQFFDMIELHRVSTLDPETQTPLDFTTYDFGVLVMGGKTSPVPSPLVQNHDDVVVNEEDLFDPEKALCTLTSDEIQQLLRGVSLRDIFRARKPESILDKPNEAQSDIRDQLTGIFNG